MQPPSKTRECVHIWTTYCDLDWVSFRILEEQPTPLIGSRESHDIKYMFVQSDQITIFHTWPWLCLVICIGGESCNGMGCSFVSLVSRQISKSISLTFNLTTFEIAPPSLADRYCLEINSGNDTQLISWIFLMSFDTTDHELWLSVRYDWGLLDYSLLAPNKASRG